MMRQFMLPAAVAVAVGLGCLTGCARGGEGGGIGVPQAVLDVWVRFAGPVDDTCYYFVALDTKGDFGTDYPVPVATGPYWGNGWGTGSMTYFLEYNLNRYDVYKTTLTAVLRTAGGGITGVSGTPTGGDAGHYTLTVGAVSVGAATVSGTGMIASATNNTGQNAGAIALTTDASGHVVAGSVSFTPAADGGRAPNTAEQAQITALNAGGGTLASGSLDAFGVTLGVAAGASAGSQTITIAPAQAFVDARFVPAGPGAARSNSTTVHANSSIATATPPIPGATLTTADLVAGGVAELDVQFSQSPILIGAPYDYLLPSGSSSLKCTIDLANLGTNLQNISLNFIATTDLIFDPNVTDPSLHCYDALGPLGNDAVTFTATEFRSYQNSTNFVQEGANDSTLQGNVSPQKRASVDIIDWWINLRRLQ